jgi:hypothetical protein
VSPEFFFEDHADCKEPTPGRTLLSPADRTSIVIDFQSQMAFATKSIDAVTLRNNAALVANGAKLFNVSFIPTTVAEKSFSGPMFDEIKAAFDFAPVSAGIAARLGADGDLRRHDRPRQEFRRRLWPWHHLRDHDVWGP